MPLLLGQLWEEYLVCRLYQSAQEAFDMHGIHTCCNVVCSIMFYIMIRLMMLGLHHSSSPHSPPRRIPPTTTDHFLLMHMR